MTGVWLTTVSWLFKDLYLFPCGFALCRVFHWNFGLWSTRGKWCCCCCWCAQAQNDAQWIGHTSLLSQTSQEKFHHILWERGSTGVSRSKFNTWISHHRLQRFRKTPDSANNTPRILTNFKWICTSVSWCWNPPRILITHISHCSVVMHRLLSQETLVGCSNTVAHWAPNNNFMVPRPDTWSLPRCFLDTRHFSLQPTSEHCRSAHLELLVKHLQLADSEARGGREDRRGGGSRGSGDEESGREERVRWCLAGCVAVMSVAFSETGRWGLNCGGRALTLAIHKNLSSQIREERSWSNWMMQRRHSASIMGRHQDSAHLPKQVQYQF